MKRRESDDAKGIRIASGMAMTCLLGLLLPGLGRAQYLLQTGAPTFTAAEPVELGFVNTANGNLHIEVPITSSPQRGSLAFDARLVYDSRIWKVVWNGSSNVWRPENIDLSRVMWRFASPSASVAGPNSFVYEMCWDMSAKITYSDFKWRAPDGTLRTFFPITTIQNYDCMGNDISTGDAFATDSSGYRMWVTNLTSAKVVAKDGTIVFDGAQSRAMDTNGNYFTISGNAVDTLNRTPVTKTVNGNTTYYDFLNSQGGTSRITVTSAQIDVSTNFGQSGVTEYASNGDPNKKLTVITRIDLPDGAYYAFTYDYGTTPGKFGLLKDVTLPTGAIVNYTHTTFQDAAGNKQRWVNQRTVNGATWSYAPALVSQCPSGATGCQQKVTVTRPSNDYTVRATKLDGGAWTWETFDYDSSGTVFKKLFVEFTTGPNYVRPVRATTQIQNTGGTWISSKTEYDYDSQSYGNLTQTREWKFYTDSPPASADRKTVMTYETGSSYTAKNILNLVTNIQVQDSTGAKQAETKISYDPDQLTSETGVTHHDDANYGQGNLIRGNPRLIERWRNVPTSTYLSTTLAYDTLGNVRTITDPKGSNTTISYTDSFYNDNDADPPSTDCSLGGGIVAKAYPTTITVPVIGSSTLGYYCKTGKLAVSTDPNNLATYFHFYDSLDRPTRTKLPDGGQASAAYTSATVRDFTTKLTASTNRIDQITLDNLGRVVKNRLDSDPQGDTDVDTSYDTSGRISAVSNPYRSSGNGSETFTYDPLSRVKQVTHPDSNNAYTYYGNEVGGNGGRTSQLCATGTYGTGYATLSKDEAGKVRQVWTDGLGRVIEVDEPDASTGSLTSGSYKNTCYKYDWLDNLTEVNQGSQTRTYTYDALSRVLSATTPEEGASGSATGTTNFYYTTSGGALCAGDPSAVCRKMDARSITTTYTYDNANRLTQKSYSSGGTTVSITYDQTDCLDLGSCYNKGGRTTMTDAAGTTKWAYDVMGRALRVRKTIGTVTKDVTYTYSLAGQPLTVTYPSGRVINYTYSTAGRGTEAKDTANSINYALSALYAPQGALASVINGQVSGGFAGVTYSGTYNNRLQPATIVATPSGGAAVLNLTYGFGTSNNGNVMTITNSLSAGRTQTFTYDYLNRIKTAQSQATSGSDCWGQSFTYDSTYYTNLSTITVTKTDPSCVQTGLSLTITNKNRFSGGSVAYDNAGNLTNDGIGHTYSWDAENRLTTTASVTYTYDGDGQRVKKSNGTLYWYGLGGEVLAETDLSGNNVREFVYMGGARIARRENSGAVYYFFGDHLGTAKVMTDDATGNVKQESTYYPFGGEQRVITNLVDNRYKFTGLERDAESGLDHTLFRKFTSNLARWLSPDPMAGDIVNPQSLNRYAYVLNNPTNLTDTLGLEGCPPGTHPAIGIVEAARSLLFPRTEYGKPYVCNTLIWEAFKRAGYPQVQIPGPRSFPNSTAPIKNSGGAYLVPISDAAARPNDLLTMYAGGDPGRGHVGVVTSTDPLSLIASNGRPGSNTGTGPWELSPTNEPPGKAGYYNAYMRFIASDHQFYRVCVPDEKKEPASAPGGPDVLDPRVFDIWSPSVIGAINNISDRFCILFYGAPCPPSQGERSSEDD